MKFILFCLVCLSFSFYSFSQEYLELMQKENVNFYDVQRSAKRYFQGKDRGRGSGYKQYKRWEYLAQKEVDDHGFLISDRQVWNEITAYNNSHSNASGRMMNTTGNWKSLGPTYWNRTSGWNPGVGRVVAIAVDSSNQNLIYVATPTGGLWKTTNGGSTWSPLSDNMPVMEVWSVSLDPQNSNTVFMGTTGGGLLKSTNGGISWSNISGVSGTIRRILIHPTNSNIIMVASNSGLRRTTNGGASWTRVVISGVEDIEFKPGDPNTVYAAGNNFFRSTNGGVSFTQISSGIIDSERMKLAVSPANSNYVYLIQKEGSRFGQLYRSTDSGLNFTIRAQYQGNNTGTNYLGYTKDGNNTGGQAWRDMAIAVSPGNANEVHIAGIICWKSNDGGSTYAATTEWFLPNSTGYNHADVEVLQFVGGNIYAGTDGGIFISTDNAANWVDLSSGLGVRQFYRIGVSQLDSNLVVGGSQDNGTSAMRSNTRNWVDWLGADGMETFVDPNNASILYGTSQYGSMYKSTNQGNSRTSIPKPTGVGNGSWVTPFEPDPTAPNTLYVGFNELYKNTGGGSGGWTAISNQNFFNLDEIAIAPSNNQYIYVADGTSVYMTSDGGSNWNNISSGVTGNVNYISVDPNNPVRVALAVSGSTKVLLSNNAGSNWIALGSGLPNISANCVLLDNSAENGIYVGMQAGVSYRNDTSTSWAPYMTGLPLVRVYELEIQYQSGKIRAATYGRGLWESPIHSSSSTGIVANFSSSATQIIRTDSVQFFANTSGNPTTWNWSFPGGTPSSSNQQNPIIRYDSAGIFDVTLRLSNGSTIDSITKQLYIEVDRHCASSANSAVDSHIERVQFAGADHQDATCSDYTDRTSNPISVLRGMTYSLSITTGDCDGGNSYDKGFKVYMDWDGNGDFDENNEMVFSQALAPSGNFSSSITVPQNAVLGQVGMRIVCSEDASILSCGSYNWGETEDYLLDIAECALSVNIDPATRDYQFCFGMDTVLNLSGGNPGGGAYSGTFVNSGQFDVKSASVGNHIYFYSLTDTSGCMGQDSGIVTINELPLIQYSQDGINPFSGDSLLVCISNPFNPLTTLGYLVPNSGNLASPIQGNWTSLGAGTIMPNANVSPGLGGLANYFLPIGQTWSSLELVTTDGNGCQTKDTLTIANTPYPNVEVFKTKSQVCYKDTFQSSINNLPMAQVITATVFRTSPGPSTFIYNGPLVNLDIVPGDAPSNPVPPISSPTYFVYEWTYTDQGGCSGILRDSILVTPGLVANHPDLPGMCETENSIQLTGGSPLGGQYSGPGVTGTNFDPGTSGPGLHQLVYTYSDTSGCPDAIDTFEIDVAPEPIAIFQVAMTGNPNEYAFTDQSINANSWLWDFGDGNTSTLQNPVHQYATEGSKFIMLEVESNYQCFSDTMYAIFIIDGLKNFGSLSNLKAFPNPVSSNLNIQLENETGNLSVWVYDAAGKLVIEKKFSESGKEFDFQMNGLPSGSYVLKLEAPNGVASLKIQKN